jgi:glycosyltransferase involved in cell wall biosynthesis
MKQLKFSIITPEHTPKNLPYLLELYESIKEQTYSDWEWVLYLNGEMTVQDLPKEIAIDPRVVVYRTFDKSNLIGKIKNQAFGIGTGDVLVEVDHDDQITPDCLEELNKAYQDDSVGFVYSDTGVLHMTDKFDPYDPVYGWSHYTYNWKGQDLIVMNSFEPSAQSIGYIWYAPDHVRSWRRTVYEELGGHNVELSICDDHELMIRTYLHTKMMHIPKCLYIYRVTGDNTWLERNEAIQTKTVELFNLHARALAEKDAKNRGLLCVDIGGGIDPHPEYITVDQRQTADHVCDLNNGIPLPDNSVGVLNASHIIEHLHDKNKTMSEIHRVLAHGGWAFIEVPSTDGRGAFQDPTHVSYWNENSFFYYTHEGYARYIENTTIRFQEFRKETYFPNEWMKSINVSVTVAWLTAVKEGGQRYPHGLYI